MRRMYSENQLELISQQEAIKVIQNGEAVENMDGYSFTESTTPEGFTFNYIYAGACKNGNKLTLVVYFDVTRTSSESGSTADLFYFSIPKAVGNKIIPETFAGINYLVAIKQVQAYSNGYTKMDLDYRIQKISIDDNTDKLLFSASGYGGMTVNTKHVCRIEYTFLLSDNLAE